MNGAPSCVRRGPRWGHLERAHFEILEARLALLRNDAAGALALAVPALAVLEMPGGEQSGRPLAERVALVARARIGDCSRALDPIETGAVDSAIGRAEAAWMRDSIRSACEWARDHARTDSH